MPIIFISLSESFTRKIHALGFDAKQMKIQDYVPNPNKRTYYVSPANSLCFMDGGIDYALSRILFPNIETKVKNIVKQLGIVSIVGKYYLPIGSSVIMDTTENTSLIISPTMLLPQNVSNTNNAYYATMAILYNILVNREEKIENVDILFTSLCCGYGKMEEDESISQIMRGINDYKTYSPAIINKNIIIHEPNLYEQPKYYQNTEFFPIDPKEIMNC
jgi:O-acetyl-ADP-ribose deacetylase (regulator of RNase III)